MPSKRILLLVLVCVSFVGFFAILKNYQNKGSLVTGIKSSPLSEVDEKDTDGDGLKDWEEVLLGTDQKNPDTNGNGIPDGKEDSFLKNTGGIALFQKNDGTSAYSKQTKTDQVAQKLLIDYLTLKKSGAVNESSINELAQSFSNTVITQQRSAQLYNTKDVVVVPETKKSILSYANTLFALINNNAYDLARVLSASKATDIASPEYTKNVLIIAKVYQAVAKKIIKIPTPTNLVSSNLSLANTYIQIGKGLEGVSVGISDYALMLGSVKNFNVDRDQEQELLKTLDNYFTTHGIIFSEASNIYILQSQ